MTYRLVTVWKNAESTAPDQLERMAIDFPTEDMIIAHIADIRAQGVVQIMTHDPPLENGYHLRSVVIPLHHVVAWYVWQTPEVAE